MLPASSPALPFCRGEPYATYFGRLAQAGDAAAALRRLVPQLDAALDGADRLALWQALHALWQRADEAQRQAAAALLDGRHGAALAALHRHWADPALIEHLARQGPAAAQAALVPALLAHHGLDPLATFEAAPEAAAPGLLLAAAQAAVTTAVAAHHRLDDGRIDRLRQATLGACERKPALVPPGLALLFELALQARDARSATGVLAELLAHGHAALLPAARVRAWLDGTAFDDDADRQRPLALSPAWQPQWLQPARWLQPGVLADLRAALRRPGPRGRLQELAVLLQQPALDAHGAPPRREVLQILAALDRAYESIDRGGDASADIQALLSRQCLAPAATAALQRPGAAGGGASSPLPQAHTDGEDHRWIECPGAQAVTIVFSSAATDDGNHALAGRLPGQHLLFVRSRDDDGCCDAAFERVHALLAGTVAARFAPEAVTCWDGGLGGPGALGGHAALKFALAFGWRAAVFNPPVDLDLWAAFRPRERALLWRARAHRELGGSAAAWARVPAYIACGSATADREALSLLIAQWQQCHQLSLIVEKFDDASHAGLMPRIAGGPPHAALARITGRLRALQQLRAAEPVAAGAAAAAFWQQLDEARACKLEITVREGRLRWQPSRGCTPGLQAAATPSPRPSPPSLRPSGVVTGPLPLKRSSVR
ncbi:MAG: hypothetical protein LCI02_15790 [Proteobacteria bacterium]|nr:hypothetical protein [Pseudomonadota bacterium]